MEKELYRYNPWWEPNFSQTQALKNREVLDLLIKQLDNNQIIFITGLRRVGKTSLMKFTLNSATVCYLPACLSSAFYVTSRA